MYGAIMGDIIGNRFEFDHVGPEADEGCRVYGGDHGVPERLLPIAKRFCMADFMEDSDGNIVWRK